MNSSQLIVLRGPSGVGKSTVGSLLHTRLERKTALFEQDHYRHTLFNNPHSELEAARQVMFASVTAALDNGYDVILEGILSLMKNGSYFDELLRAHPENNYFFYFEASFEETAKRHQTRHKSDRFSAEKMREWYDRALPTGFANEHFIPEHSTAEQSMQIISTVAGLPLISADAS